MSKIRDLGFDAVGGLHEHIQTLKEMIIYPLLYQELFDVYGIQSPRGVLFYGPPGTGKTLMAGALVSECSKCSTRNVAFYMRKGGECFSKYVGESEKHLQNLFAQAYSTRPSIIFFDEIDGLATTRSEMQEHVHASVITTLLALMDGLDSKSGVFVIGATNRIDMIDPALRRPGRFDRELYFPLPALESRLEIFKIHTNNWTNKPSEELLLKLAAECSGYCGADIQSLCSQAVMKSFSRSFPQVVDTSKRQSITFGSIHVRDDDFWEAKTKIVPAIHRVYAPASGPLRSELEPLLKKILNEAINRINKVCPFCFLYRKNKEISKSESLSCPRFLLIGNTGQAHISHIAPAVLHIFDHLPVIVTDLASINEEGHRSSDSSSFVRKIDEARQTIPSIIYFKNITSWWNLIDEPAKQVLITSLEGLDSSRNCQIFIFGSATACSYNYLPAEIKQIFPKKMCFEVGEPTVNERKNFFRQVIVDKNLKPPKVAEVPFYPKSCQSGWSDFQEIEVEKKPPVEIGRLRNGKSFRPNFDGSENPPSKKMKFAVSYDPGYSSDTKVERSYELKVDVKKLEKLVDSAVKVTSKSGITSLIRLYEELEIISLKYAPLKDRSKLSQELEREISVFIP